MGFPIVISIEDRIFQIRGVKVMIGRDLAELYQVPTYALNQAVKRNKDRFPEGFMFRLSRRETRELITNCDRFAALKDTARRNQISSRVFRVRLLASEKA